MSERPEAFIELLPPDVGHNLRHIGPETHHLTGEECHCRPERVPHEAVAARPATLAASAASRVVGGGSDAAEAREALSEAEHLRRAHWEMTQEAARLRDEVERQARTASDIEDWRLHEVARAEAAEAEVERLEGNLSALLCDLTGGRLSKTTYDVRTMVQAIEEYFEESTDDDGLARTASAIAAVTPCSCSAQRARAESAERARDAALAEVTGLRDRLGRVEALHHEAYPGARWCAGCHDAARSEGWPCPSSAALAVPVTGDTEDASPTAVDVERDPTFFRDKVTGEPCPRRGNVLCTLPYSPDHLHVAAHMWDAGAASPTEQATESGAK